MGTSLGCAKPRLPPVILRIPTNARDLVLPNSRYALLDQGFLYAEGLAQCL